MFKIRVFFKSNEKGIYTEEIDISSDEKDRDVKYKRAINRWFELLCCKCDAEFIDISCYVARGPHFDPMTTIRKCKEQMENDIRLHIIQQKILFMNQFKRDGEDDAKFEIEVMEVKRCTCH